MTEKRKRNRKEADLIGDDDDDDEETELLAAAAVWADEQVPTPPTPSASAPSFPPSKKFSLHITQIPYECTELDIRSHFAAKGCAVVSIRMVYDETGEGKKSKRFRGVAFCDVADETSYDTALKELHRSRILGRKINVRPTRTREELSNIVERTKEIVTERKKLAIAAVNSGEKMPEELTASSKKKRKVSEKKTSSTKKNDGKKKAAKKDDSEKTTPKKKGQSKEGNEKTKLTKQQRNRRAAILAQRAKK